MQVLPYVPWSTGNSQSAAQIYTPDVSFHQEYDSTMNISFEFSVKSFLMGIALSGLLVGIGWLWIR
jgi:hypothetical protein